MSRGAESTTIERVIRHKRLFALTLLAAIFAGVPVFAATTLWWDTAYLFRYNVDVQTGANLPDKGYNGYTSRIATLDTQALVAAGQMQADCSDLRALYYNGLVWQELPRHVVGCDTATTDIRFKLAADIAASSNDDNYYIYYGNPAPAGLPAMSTTNVYLWYDDATVNRATDYTRGRVDAWHGSGWDNSLAWNAAGYYTYDTGDNFTSGYRRAIDERDVYVEAEFFHTACYDLNMTSGILTRGIINSGTLGSERSNHYYASIRSQFPSGCNQPGGYNNDGDIIKDQLSNGPGVIDGPNPPAMVPNVWRRQALASWLTGPTNLSFWDEDLSADWAALGFPDGTNLQVSGTDTNNQNTGRGFAGIMTAQDAGRVRNILMRRYVAPEPVLVLTPEAQPPVIVLQKSLLTVFDPVNNNTNPIAIPGAWVEYTITASNSGSGNVDADTFVVTDPLPANIELFVGDLGVPNSGPVEFIDGVGIASSGMSFVYGGLADQTDDVDFSTDGVNWAYVPTPDAGGFSAAVQFIRVRPSGSFAGTATATPTQFGLRIRVRVQE
jgi:uncharacterized repeat protein (TIGR01451 family)